MKHVLKSSQVHANEIPKRNFVSVQEVIKQFAVSAKLDAAESMALPIESDGI